MLLGTISVWSLHAQQRPMIHFPNPVATIADALDEIEKQTGYHFSVNHANFDVSRKVNLPPVQIGLEDALKQILYGTGRTYMLRGNHILVIPQDGVPVIAASPKETVQPGTASCPNASRGGLVRIQSGSDITVVQSGQALSTESRFSAHRQAAWQTNRTVNPDKSLPVLAIKANLLYGAVAFTPNLGLEVGVSPHSTIDIRGSYNQWGLEGSWEENKKLAHWTVSGEYRYWFCERFSGHFVGAHGFYGYYNISQHKLPLLFGNDSDQYRYKGNIFGAGISYGYQWYLGKRWNLEAQIGIGAGRMKYDQYDCPRCGDPVNRDKNRTYFGPTRAGITIMYLIK